MQEKSKCLSELLNEECQLVIIKLTEVLSDWYKQAQAAFIQTEILAKDMTQFEKSMSEFLNTLDNSVESYQTDLELLTNELKELHQENKLGGSSRDHEGDDFSVKTLDADFRGNKSKSSPNRGSSREQHAKSMRKGIKDLCVLQEEVWSMVKENADLVNQFQALTLSLFSSEGSPYPPSLNTPEKSESDVSVSGKSE
ncbi:unnamed protein product [Allacma fusca]|uniref:Uncharacterized protein n=1 Tax=Allacma fusca TaxID=39272 RepID=A0A8J2PST0_9HEXA|nr:unnamed protein product [Allacma fusca]